jgi:lysophospholipase L1-like esterase
MGLRRTTQLLAALAAVVTALAVPSAQATAETATTDTAPSYYLSLGDSLAIGVQPDSNGVLHATDAGYADVLYGRLHATDPSLVLTKLGCSGESTKTFLIGGICRYGTLHSQLVAALAFLADHRDHVRLITINLGGNDIGPCAGVTGIDLKCVDKAMKTIHDNLTVAMAALRVLAPSVPMIGMNFYDPVIAFPLFLPDGQAIADASIPLNSALNRMMEGVYAAYGAPTADVEGAFQTFDTTPVTVPGLGVVPLNLARICQWLFMCVPPPVGPNDHPNNDGYIVIADAFQALV